MSLFSNFCLLVAVCIVLSSCEKEDPAFDCTVTADDLFNPQLVSLTKYKPRHGQYYTQDSKLGVRVDKYAGSPVTWQEVEITVGGAVVDKSTLELKDGQYFSRTMDYWFQVPSEVVVGRQDLIIRGMKGDTCFTDTLHVEIADVDLDQYKGTFASDITLGAWVIGSNTEYEDSTGDIVIRAYESGDAGANTVPPNYNICDKWRCLTMVLPNKEQYSFPINHEGDLHELSSYHYYHDITISGDTLIVDIVGPGGNGYGYTVDAVGHRNK